MCVRMIITAVYRERHHYVNQRLKESRIQKSLRTNCALHSKNNLYKVILTLNSRSSLKCQTNQFLWGLVSLSAMQRIKRLAK